MPSDARGEEICRRPRHNGGLLTATRKWEILHYTRGTNTRMVKSIYLDTLKVIRDNFDYAQEIINFQGLTILPYIKKIVCW